MILGLDQVFLWSATNRIAREDLANRTLPSRLQRQRRGRDNSIHEKQRKGALQKPRLLRRYALMNSRSPLFIGIVALNLSVLAPSSIA